MTPGTLNLVLYKGATFGPITLICKTSENTVVPLTGYTAEAQVRSKGDGPLVLDLTPTIPTPATDGKVVLYITDEDTAAVKGVGDYIWDLFLINGSGERLGPFVAGKFTIKVPVTRSE